jgi:Flp pilus assembly protein TadB
LTVLLVVEILVDKVPAADTVNDVIHTFIRPAAGAILFAATTNTIGLHPILAAVLGVILAGGVHAVKAGGRPVVAATTAGMGNPVVSTIEDIISFATSVLAIVAPYLVVAIILISLTLFIWWYVRRRQRRAH